MMLKKNIGIYCGDGASHSWLWFAGLADRVNLRGIKILDEHDVLDGALNNLQSLFISGGDTFGIAKALGEKGANEIETFVKNGGKYIGACAGAYLPLHSSKEH